MANPLNVDHVYCLTLDRRLEFALQLEKSCVERGWDFTKFISGDGETLPRDHYDLVDDNQLPPYLKNMIRYPSWTARPQAANAFRSHKTLFKRCLDKEHESVFFLEEDAKFMGNFDTAFPLVEEFAARTDWDIFYVGNFLLPADTVMVHPIISKVAAPCMGFHAVALKKHIIAKLSNWLKIGPMDYICSEYLCKHFNAYACVPPLMVQRGAFSFVENHWLGRRVEDNYC